MPYVSPPVGTYDVDSPITDEFLDTLVGNADWLKALLESHAHSGADGSVAIEIGSNAVRNGSFESGTTNWTLTQYTGGTIATTTAHDMDGATALSIASSVLANGGGDAVSAPIACSGQVGLLVKAMVKASVANVSCAIKVQWLDDAQAQISETTVYSATSTPTTMLPVAELVSSPATARYYRIRLIGGVPATGSATGTIYFDGVFAKPLNDLAVPGDTIRYRDTTTHQSVPPGYTEQINVFVPVGGTYRFVFDLRGTGTAGFYTGYARLYLDGVAYGTERSQISTGGAGTYQTFTEDLFIPPGSNVQLFMKTSDNAQPSQVTNFYIKAGNRLMALPQTRTIGDR